MQQPPNTVIILELFTIMLWKSRNYIPEPRLQTMNPEIWIRVIQNWDPAAYETVVQYLHASEILYGDECHKLLELWEAVYVKMLM